MIHFYSRLEEDSYNCVPNIRKQWNDLLSLETRVRKFLDKLDLSEPFIAQYYASSWLQYECFDVLVYFLKKLAQSDPDIYIFYYGNNEYVSFSGHNDITISKKLKEIEEHMLAECFKLVLEKESSND